MCVCVRVCVWRERVRERGGAGNNPIFENNHIDVSRMRMVITSAERKARDW